jgi:hypothetical protein
VPTPDVIGRAADFIAQHLQASISDAGFAPTQTQFGTRQGSMNVRTRLPQGKLPLTWMPLYSSFIVKLAGVPS